MPQPGNVLYTPEERTYTKVVGRTGVDFSALGNFAQQQIPKDARGVYVTWQPDNNGACQGTVAIYLGEVSGMPWGVLLAPVPTTKLMTICAGPLFNVFERGSYMTIVPSTATPARGFLWFEWIDSVVGRANG
jgi:hypothetical protein